VNIVSFQMGVECQIAISFGDGTKGRLGEVA
jgi:hypothetical protein